MATTTQQESSNAGEFTFNAREHGHPAGPDQVHVEISPVDRQTHMAILAAGADGRYSFDFRYSRGTVEIQKAYVEGMRVDVDELPDWIDSVRDRVEKELGA